MSMKNKDWIGNKKSVWATLGASNHSDKERASHDYYATDPKAVEMLEQAFPLHRKIWEPACGAGHLSKFLETEGHDVLSTDLVDRGYGHGDVNFLAIGTGELFNGGGDRLFAEWRAKSDEPFDILTNPPFAKSTDFILKALELIPEGGRVIMLLRTTSLEGKERKERIYDKYPPRFLFQFSGRIVCAKNGDFEPVRKIGSAQAYCWYIWEKENKEHKTELYWLPTTSQAKDLWACKSPG